jgi:putative ABC transport system permease protein
MGIANTGSSATNDKFITMPLELAQTLYDTDAVDRIVLLLDDVAATERIRVWLEDKLSAIGFEAEVKTWKERSMTYESVHALYTMIFFFIFCIVLVIVVTSVINTMTMTVAERTQEIGTLRAMGLKRRNVIKLFGTEGMVIGALGVVTGLLATLLLIWLITVINFGYSAPGVSVEVPLAVDVVPDILGASGLFLIMLGFVAAILPSRSASRLKIVDAFGHV